MIATTARGGGAPEASSAIAWARSSGLTDYAAAVAAMDARVADIAAGRASELVWLVEHPPLYTAGSRAKPADIQNPMSLPVIWSNRGGEVTYHGPGQRVVYVMLDVQRRFGGDMAAFIAALEDWIIGALAAFEVPGYRIAGRTGVWVTVGEPPSSAEAGKIAAIGLRVRRGISLHGIALNVAPDLSHFAGIVPCGITDAPVTSLAARAAAAGRPQPSMKDVDIFLEAAFRQIFLSPIRLSAPPL